MADFRIRVIVDPTDAERGIRRTERALGRAESASQNFFRTLQRGFLLFSAGAAVKQITDLADAYVNTQNRINLVTKNTAQLNAVTTELFKIADRTRASFESTATIYSRTALSVKELGLSQRETLNFTESLNKAILISGVNAQEASNGLIQLSQGIASGTLRGDELRSVLEQLPAVADVISVHLGITRGELRLLGQQGKISGKDIINAFANASDSLDKAFNKTTATISQAFGVLQNNIIRVIGEINASTGAVTSFSEGIIVLATNLDVLGKVAIIVGTTLAVGFAKQGVIFATRAVIAFSAALLANPIGAFIILLTIAVTSIIQFGDEVLVLGSDFITLKDLALGALQFIIDKITPLKDAIVKGFKTALTFVIKAFNDLNLTLADTFTFGKNFVNRFIGIFVGLGKALQSIFVDIREIVIALIGESLLGDLVKAADAVINGSKKGLQFIKDLSSDIVTSLGLVAESVGETLSNFELPEADASFAGNMIRIGQNAGDAFIEGFNKDYVGELVSLVAPGLRAIEDEIESNAAAIARKRLAAVIPATPSGDLDEKAVPPDRLPLALREQLELLEKQAGLLSLSNRERAIEAAQLKIIQKLRTSNVTLTEAQTELLSAAIRRNQILSEEADLLNKIKGPLQEITRTQETLNSLYDKGRISLDELHEGMMQILVDTAELNVQSGQGSFTDGFILGIQDMMESVRNFGSEAGEVFADFFEQTTEGFSSAIADSIIFGDSLSEGLGNAAREALASLLSGLINVGIQFVLNKTLSDQLVASQLAGTTAVTTATTAAQGVTTASSLAASTATTAGIVADNAIIATSAAPAAALESTATFGGAAVAGLSALAAILGFAAGAANFADGGMVRGAGGPRSDDIPAMLSNGEFVVNAKSTARFRPQLEAMNSGRGLQDGGFVSDSEANGTQVAQSSQAVNNTRIVNVLDPSMVGDFLATSDGEELIVNIINNNSDAVRGALA